MHLSVIFAFVKKNIYLCSKLINLPYMAKKKNDGKPSTLDEIALQKFFAQIDEVQRESRASDIGVVDDMYRYTGEEETNQTNNEEVPQQAASPASEGETQQQAAVPVSEGKATGDGKPAGEPVPEPPKGGPGGGASGGRPAGRKRSARMPQVAASEGSVHRLNLIGADVPRIKMLLYMLKMKGVRGSNAKIVLDYLERGVRKDHPDLVKIVDTLMGSPGEAKDQG